MSLLTSASLLSLLPSIAAPLVILKLVLLAEAGSVVPKKLIGRLKLAGNWPPPPTNRRGPGPLPLPLALSFTGEVRLVVLFDVLSPRPKLVVPVVGKRSVKFSASFVT